MMGCCHIPQVARSMWLSRKSPCRVGEGMYGSRVRVEFCLCRGVERASALTKQQKQNPRRRERPRRTRETRSDLAAQGGWPRTERRTETRSPSKDYAAARADAVNERAAKSLE